MQLLPLKRGIIYGPVSSRRLGASLGVNILPHGGKTCTFNCLYCQYGWTTCDGSAEGTAWPPASLVLDTLRSALEKLITRVDFITFSGNGEPSLHPDFGAIAGGVVSIRNRIAPGAKTAILSNSTRAHLEDVQRALRSLDVRIMKLDAGTDAVLRAYNSPAPGISLPGIATALRSLGDVTLQALFSGGPDGNSAPEHVDEWIRLVREIRPTMVQIYTLDRPFPSREIAPVSRTDLLGIRELLRRAGIRGEAY